MSSEREGHSWISYGHVHSARSRGLVKTIGPDLGAPHEGDLRGAPACEYAGDDVIIGQNRAKIALNGPSASSRLRESAWSRRRCRALRASPREL